MSALDDAALLSARAACWPDRKFDEASICGHAPHDSNLLAALQPLAVVVRRSGCGARLRARDERAILGWLLRVENRRLGVLTLRRDGRGWCSIEGKIRDLDRAGPGGRA